CMMDNTKLNNQQQVSEIMSHLLTQAPLCAYTTLFRSEQVLVQPLHEERVGRVRAGVLRREQELLLDRFPAQAGQELIRPAEPAGDRECTRLNSSHDQISYAVFCAKNKKSTQTDH